MIINKMKAKLKKPKSLFTKDQKLLKDYEIGGWTYGIPEVLSWQEGTTLQIGKYCSISENVTILLGGEHRIDWVTTYPFTALFPEYKDYKGHPRSKGNVIIGNDVWIARDVLILSGVNIGNGAVIGAGSIVTKDIADYSVASGNPARHIKWRFEQDKIAKLRTIAWWDWPHAKVLEALPFLLSTNIEKFIEKFEKAKIE
jgi:acetyltransferase-like isoleucine patch superfamily enzyme